MSLLLNLNRSTHSSGVSIDHFKQVIADWVEKLVTFNCSKSIRTTRNLFTFNKIDRQQNEATLTSFSFL